VIYDYGSCASLTSDVLHCRYRPVLLSERATYMKKRENFRKRKEKGNFRFARTG
jgi:hypothetical protein